MVLRFPNTQPHLPNMSGLTTPANTDSSLYGSSNSSGEELPFVFARESQLQWPSPSPPTPPPAPTPSPVTESSRPRALRGDFEDDNRGTYPWDGITAYGRYAFHRLDGFTSLFM